MEHFLILVVVVVGLNLAYRPKPLWDMLLLFSWCSCYTSFKTHLCFFFLQTYVCILVFSRFSFKFLFFHDFIMHSLALVGSFHIGIDCQTSQVFSPIGNLIGSKSVIETKIVVLLFSKCIQSILLRFMSKVFH